MIQEYLGDFVSLYVDDLLVYTNGSLKDHQRHVQLVLQKLLDAGLQLDIDKCKFNIRLTKYLGC
jgi:hypothetical protein